MDNDYPFVKLLLNSDPLKVYFDQRPIAKHILLIAATEAARSMHNGLLIGQFTFPRAKHHLYGLSEQIFRTNWNLILATGIVVETNEWKKVKQPTGRITRMHIYEWLNNPIVRIEMEGIKNFIPSGNIQAQQLELPQI